MERDEVIELISIRKLFDGASPEELGKFVDVSHEVSIEKDSLMIEEGKMGEAVWILIDGSVAILVDGEERLLDEPGTIFGEISAVSQTAATATVRAATEVKARKIPHQDFHRALTSSQELAASVLRSMSKYL